MSAMSWSVSSWRPETLTAIPIGYPAARHAAPCEQACSRTHPPTSTISPVSSSSGMKSSGCTTPRVGCFQRISASTPVGLMSLRSIVGW